MNTFVNDSEEHSNHSLSPNNNNDNHNHNKSNNEGIITNDDQTKNGVETKKKKRDQKT